MIEVDLTNNKFFYLLYFRPFRLCTVQVICRLEQVESEIDTLNIGISDWNTEIKAVSLKDAIYWNMVHFIVVELSKNKIACLMKNSSTV
ncbi:hypothetical protein P8452_21419 [Trifolium repens]|nr:hypothetical protein P8452_21419 [Trifolium repens]